MVHKTMTDVFVAGALHLDVVVSAPRLPLLDETLMGDSVAYRLGGKGANQAVAAARMGARVSMAGRIGTDRFGENLLDALDAAEIERSQVRQCEGASGMSVAILDSQGDYGAVVISGVNREIRAEDIALPATLPVLLLQNEIPEAVNLALAVRTDPATKVILNAAPARDVPAELLTRCTLLVVNRLEAAQMLGTGPELLDPAAAAAALQARGPTSVIITLGADGYVGVPASGPAFGAAAYPVALVSTHGAGDAFCGALATALCRDASLEDAARFAQAAAGLTVATPPDQRDAIDTSAVHAFIAQTKSP